MGRPKSIGLVMIVKNEAGVIVRCLESAKSLIDYVLISDTGSTDGTQEIIRDWLKAEGISGEVIERPWLNFAHNRSEALAALREVEGVDYALTIDADEMFRVTDDLDVRDFKSNLTADVYDVEVHYSGLRYGRPCLFSNRLPLVYKAVLHEYLEIPDTARRARADALTVHVTQDGARSRNENKFLDDARVLEAALNDENDPFLRSRYTFYLGQSYYDAGQWQASYEAYLRRVDMGFWIEEVYVSLLRAAQASARLGHPSDVQLALYLRAYDLVPGRAEALREAAATCRKAERYNVGYLFAKKGVELAPPEGALFLDTSAYDYGLLDELQIAAYWSGRYEESLAVAERILREARYPGSEHERLLANARFARDRVAAVAA